MPNTTPLKIKLYGGLREYAEEVYVMLDITLPQTCHDVKQALEKALMPEAHDLVQQCALATDDAILTADDMIGVGQTISALPPVCGG